MDADVLIDFCTADLTALALVSRHLRPVLVPTPLLGEVRQLDAAACERHGLKLYEPSTEQLLAAAARRRSLSFLDHLCLTIARDEGWVCATNDKVLRRECRTEGVQILWGLELLVDLVEAEHLTRTSAIHIATEIHTNNRHHITRRILGRFKQRLRESKR